MSVLIKGMKMPVSCYECPMAIEMDMQGDWYECNLLKNHFYSFDVTADQEEYHRPKGCPLAEVPSDEETQKYNAYQDEMGGAEAQAMMEGYENPYDD